MSHFNQTVGICCLASLLSTLALGGMLFAQACPDVPDAFCLSQGYYEDPDPTGTCDFSASPCGNEGCSGQLFGVWHDELCESGYYGVNCERSQITADKPVYQQGCDTATCDCDVVFTGTTPDFRCDCS